MNQSLEKNRIIIFLVIAFGIAWLVGLIIYLTGGLADSPVLVPGTPFTLAFLLALSGYMWAPAVGNLFTRALTHESKDRLMLRPWRRGWLYWLAAWVMPAILTVLGALVFFTIYPQHYDASLETVRKLLEQGGQNSADPWKMVILQTSLGILMAPFINGLAAFGEEFGWRGYLLPKLMPLGGRTAALVSGVIWGVWHWPIIAMGHNFGLDYTGSPWLGMLVMVWFTVIFGTFLAWVTLRSRCVWPAVIGHAAINGIASLAMIFTIGTPNLLIGPMPVGLVGSAGLTLVAVILYLVPGALDTPPDLFQAGESNASESTPPV